MNFAVIGNPIKHSLSPHIHNTFASNTNLNNFRYGKIESTKLDFRQDVDDFFNKGGIGLNVTVPFKVNAYEMCDEVDEYASSCRSVNTLTVKGNKLCGYSTDGIGFIDDMHEKSIDINDKKILIIGAGGSARSVLAALIREKCHLNIINRSRENLETILKMFSYNNLSEHERGNKYDLVINTTPISVTKEVIKLPKNIFAHGSVSYDLFYDNDTTHFQKWSKDNGCASTFDGLGMLIHQAKHSFRIWNQSSPPTIGLENILRSL